MMSTAVPAGCRNCQDPRCCAERSRIASYLNPQLLNAGLSEEYVYPNQDAWQAGVRTVVCEVSSTTGPLSGSVRSSG